MPSLKEFRDRIASVKSTRKITSAMKMVAASKLKRAQDQAVASQPYAAKMASILSRLAESTKTNPDAPRLLIGTGKQEVHLLVVITSDRGLCGGFNGSLIRAANRKINELKAAGKTVKVLTIGRKGYDSLRKVHADSIEARFPVMEGKQLKYSDAEKVMEKILSLFAEGAFDVCTIISNKFNSVISQVPTTMQLIPFEGVTAANQNTGDAPKGVPAIYEFEPSEEAILEKLLPLNLGTQIFRSMLDSAAGEQAARMTAMDNATRNAGDMIGRMTLQYNRARQAYITKELIEIISGAEAI